jgi:nucleotide-binding universal stress UspA family protein
MAAEAQVHQSDGRTEQTMINVRSYTQWSQVPGLSMPRPVHRRLFRVVAGVDWSGDSLAGVREIAALYAMDELILVHAVPLSRLQSQNEKARPRHLLPGNDLRHESVAAARRHLTWVSTLIQKAVASAREVCDVGTPAGVLLDTARTTGAALIVVGQRGAREQLDRTMGSVSHRLCLNADRSILVIRKPLRIPRRVLALVQQTEDAIALQRWLRTFPFKEKTDLTVLCFVPRSQRGDPIGPLSVRFWNEAAMTNARSLLEPMIRDVQGPRLRVGTRIVRGDPSRIVLQEALNFDLLMLHGSDRKGRDPMRSGLPWRALLPLAPCSTLIVRTGGWS